MRSIIRAFGWLLTAITLAFALLQLYIDRRIAAIEANGLLLQMASDEETTDYGVRWALSEIAACQPWGDLNYRPDNALSMAEFVSQNRDRWESCRDQARDLRRIEAGEFDFEDLLFCPDTSEKFLPSLYGALSGGEQGDGVAILRSDLSCVRLDDAVLTRARVADSTLIGSSFELARLANSRWVDSDLRWARFDDAELSGAAFSGQALRLDGASFERARLQNAVFDDAVDLSLTSFRDADLSGADLADSRGLSRRAVEAACVRDGRQPALPQALADVTLRPCR